MKQLPVRSARFLCLVTTLEWLGNDSHVQTDTAIYSRLGILLSDYFTKDRLQGSNVKERWMHFEQIVEENIQIALKEDGETELNKVLKKEGAQVSWCQYHMTQDLQRSNAPTGTASSLSSASLISGPLP